MTMHFRFYRQADARLLNGTGAENLAAWFQFFANAKQISDETPDDRRMYTSKKGAPQTTGGTIAPANYPKVKVSPVGIPARWDFNRKRWEFAVGLEHPRILDCFDAPDDGWAMLEPETAIVVSSFAFPTAHMIPIEFTEPRIGPAQIKTRSWSSSRKDEKYLQTPHLQCKSRFTQPRLHWWEYWLQFDEPVTGVISLSH